MSKIENFAQFKQALMEDEKITAMLPLWRLALTTKDPDLKEVREQVISGLAVVGMACAAIDGNIDDLARAMEHAV